jgi:hypothetical protein
MVRLYLHLPAQGYDHDNGWQRFSRAQHMSVVKEIELHLGEDRFQGISYEVHAKPSGGIWQGKREKNTVLYLDLRANIRDIEWCFKMKDVWGSKERFNQDVIYVSVHPIWVLENSELEQRKLQQKGGR